MESQIRGRILERIRFRTESTIQTSEPQFLKSVLNSKEAVQNRLLEVNLICNLEHNGDFS